MAQINLVNKTVSDTGPAYVIAEVGHNHMGDIAIAKKMVDVARATGCDCVKFQRVDASALFTKRAYNESYTSEHAFADTYGKHREALTLSDDNLRELLDYCQRSNIMFACTPFEEWSADFLQEIGCPVFKLASFHMRDYALIDHVKGFGKPMIISTGNSDALDIWRLVEHMGDYRDYALLHCTSEYPVRDEEHINLGALLELKAEFPALVWGYSHHYKDPFPAALSYSYGARIVETHITLDRSWKGTDQSFSLEPDDLRWLVDRLRMAHKTGGRVKRPHSEEQAPIRKMSRSIYPTQKLRPGDKLEPIWLQYKAPGDGLPTAMLDEVVGKVLINAVSTDAPIRKEDIDGA